MRILHIYKTQPDQTTKTLVDVLSRDQEITEFELFKDDADYEKLLDLVFEHDKIITWW